jgi:carbonic anhydrase/acetyltransferase-like protein (isoleucine patch superfamily)
MEQKERHMNAKIGPAFDQQPQIPDSCFVAPGAVVLGAVTLGERANIWFNSTVRGDVHWITIGEDTNIQDNSVLHVTHDTNPLAIGARVTCGHAVRLHGCTIEDETLIGIGAIVLDGAVVQTGAMVAAGAVVPPGMVVPGGMLVAGVPARVIREVTPAERENIGKSAGRYVAYADQMKRDLTEAH